MKQKKIVLVRMGKNISNGKSDYHVEKTFNITKPLAGDILTTSEMEQYVQSRSIDVEIKAEK